MSISFAHSISRMFAYWTFSLSPLAPDKFPRRVFPSKFLVFLNFQKRDLLRF